MYFRETTRKKFAMLHAIPDLPADVVVGGNPTESGLMRMEYSTRTARPVTRIKLLKKATRFFQLDCFET